MRCACLWPYLDSGRVPSDVVTNRQMHQQGRCKGSVSGEGGLDCALGRRCGGGGGSDGVASARVLGAGVAGVPFDRSCAPRVRGVGKGVRWGRPVRRPAGQRALCAGWYRRCPRLRARGLLVGEVVEGPRETWC